MSRRNLTPAAVRIAVIGCGRWGPNHIRCLRALPGARVVACADTDRAALARMAERFDGIVAARPEDVLRDPEIDAVVIAAPAAAHYELTRRALLSGKHVLCEKPLCRTALQAAELVALARRKKRVLMVGHVFLFDAGLIELKKSVDSGRLGRIRSITAVRVNPGPVRSDVNVAYDLAAHDIAICNWLLDDIPRRVVATGRAFLRDGIDDVAFVTLYYRGRIRADIHASWLHPEKVRRLTVVGERRTASWDARGSEELVEEPLMTQARAFLFALRSGAPEHSGPAFSAGVVRVLDAVARSMKKRGGSVTVPPGGRR